MTCAGGDGNLLLNVGPMPSGEIEARQADRLREMGRWLQVHGESIYGTRGGPWRPGAWGVSTRKGADAYLHVLQWPDDAPLALPARRAARGVGARARRRASADAAHHGDGLDVRVAPAASARSTRS